MNFVAIDFETANGSRNSACSLGVVVIENGRITDRRYSLINPQMPFSRYCSYIHGITPPAVKGAPTFSDIYPEVYRLLNGKVLVAHNAPFDVAVLRASCEARGLEMPQIEPFCSVEMSRTAWPELPHHRLNSLAEHFQLPLNHHNAIGDATVCAQLVLLCADSFGANNMTELKGMLAIKARRNREEARIQKARIEAEAQALQALRQEAELRNVAASPTIQ